MISNKKIWDKWEIIAIYFLQKKWYKIIDSNYKVAGGEIDIVAEKSGKLIFIEVKYRRSLSHWAPEEMLTKIKRKNIARTIKQYCLRNKVKNENIWFDFIAITEENSKAKINHFENVEL